MGNHGAVGGGGGGGLSSENRRSSFNMIWYQKQVERQRGSTAWMDY